MGFCCPNCFSKDFYCFYEEYSMEYYEEILDCNCGEVGEGIAAVVYIDKVYTNRVKETGSFDDHGDWIINKLESNEMDSQEFSEDSDVLCHECLEQSAEDFNDDDWKRHPVNMEDWHEVTKSEELLFQCVHCGNEVRIKGKRRLPLGKKQQLNKHQMTLN